jgi:hypothetical protein
MRFPLAPGVAALPPDDLADPALLLPRAGASPACPLGEGRRVYIHARSFLWLAAAVPGRAGEVFGPILAASALKRLHHALQDEAPVLLGPERSQAGAVHRLAAASCGRSLTALLRQLGTTSRHPRRRYGVYPLLGPGEKIEASCFDGGYYTFATTPAAARLMYADSVPMRHLRALHGLSDASEELTVVSGRSLVFLRSGGSLRSDYRDVLELPLALDRVEVPKVVAGELAALRDAFPAGPLVEVLGEAASRRVAQLWEGVIDDLADIRFA